MGQDSIFGGDQDDYIYDTTDDCADVASGGGGDDTLGGGYDTSDSIDVEHKPY